MKRLPGSLDGGPHPHGATKDQWLRPHDKVWACMRACVRAVSLQSCPTLCNPTDCSPPRLSVTSPPNFRWVCSTVLSKSELPSVVISPHTHPRPPLPKHAHHMQQHLRHPLSIPEKKLVYDPYICTSPDYLCPLSSSQEIILRLTTFLITLLWMHPGLAMFFLKDGPQN